jgi:hypothetical protein
LRCDDVVQIVAEEFGTAMAPMAIKDGKKLDLLGRLLRVVRLKPWLLEI